jgi:hypothetical protein
MVLIYWGGGRGGTKGGKGKEAFLVATREVGLKVCAETTKYMFVSRDNAATLEGKE